MKLPTRQAALAAAAFLLALVSVVAVAPPDEASAINETPIDLQNLDLVPLRTWGVSGQDPTQTQTSTLDVLVWDFAQIGDRMFVGGGFLNVQESKNSTPIRQSFIAAFDLNTGDWIESWRPTVDRVVYALDVAPNGSLLVGGEFEAVNGRLRRGLVALDPITGAIDPTFVGRVDRPWSDARAMVRDIEVIGDDTYVAGNFSHINGSGGARTRVYKVGRFTDQYASIDGNWKPQITGSSVWGIDVSTELGEATLAGFFSAANGEASSGYFHTVNLSNGASAPGKKDIPRNFPRSQPEFFDATYGNDLVFAIGEQHIIQVLEADDHDMTGFHTTGASNDGFEYTGGFSGGAFQVGERIGNIIFAGCHCTRSARNGVLNHYSSFSGRRTGHRLAMAYNASNGQLLGGFRPDINSPRDGTWAFGSDTNGCLYLGGDFHVGGLDSGQNRWLGGFGKFCPEGFDPNTGGNNASALVPAGDSWSYNAAGNDLGTSWRNVNYNDGGWPTGNAEFGFGDGDESRVWPAGNTTYYARTSFEFSGTLPSSLALDLAADDGAVVYLNGQEILRDNMPAGTIRYSTQAASWRSGAQEKMQAHIVASSALRQGTNVLAVEVHNIWANNSDLSFDLRLSGSDENPPVVQPGGPLVEAGSAWSYSQGTAAPANWKNGQNLSAQGTAEFGFGDGDETTVLTSGREAYYFAKTFTVVDPAAFDQLTLGLAADDGAVVYINGREVHRVNMPAGTISYNTRPTAWASGADETMKSSTISASSLVAGNNVIAVEVHNFWPGNSDLSFDLELG